MNQEKIFILLFLAVVNGVESLRRVCYYTNWAQYRPGSGKYVPEDMDPHLCTHIIYSFAKLNGNKLAPFEWNDDSTEWMKGMYAKFNAVKVKNPRIKTLLAIGGWNMGSEPFTQMVKSSQTRQEFAKSAVAFLRKRNFDGLDLDWEYPANRGSPPKDKHRFTLLVQQLREAFDRESLTSGRPRLLLTAAVAAGKKNIDSGYDVPAIGRLMDFISIMTYDLHGSWESTCGHNSPLFPRSGETGIERYLNLDWAATYWNKMGVPKSKLNIGMGLYGRSFTLKDRNIYNVGAEASGKGLAGKFTREAGFLSYYEICDMLKNGAKKYYINDQKVPYLVKGDQWVGYDDVDSLSIKVQYVKQQRYGGVMVWALDLDDFKGSCGQGRYPLLKRINQEIEGARYQPEYPMVDVHHVPPVFNEIPPIPRPQRPTIVHHVPPVFNEIPPISRPQRPTIVHHVPPVFNEIPPIPRPQRPITQNIIPRPQRPRIQNTTPRRQRPHTKQTMRRPQRPRTQKTVRAPERKAPRQKSRKIESIDQLRTNSKDFTCKKGSDGYFASPTSCSGYYMCTDGTAFKFDCASGLMFNPKYNFCDWPDKVKCKDKKSRSSKKTARPRQKTSKRTNIIPPVPKQTPVGKPAPPRWRPPQEPNIETTIRDHWNFDAPAQTAHPPVLTSQAPTLQPNAWDWVSMIDNPMPFFMSLFGNNDVFTDSCANKQNGIYSDRENCRGFIECSEGVSFKGACGPGLAFNPSHQTCDYTYNVPGCQ